jgi:3-oxoacyl-[acyl-carrier-protein] synthase I
MTAPVFLNALGLVTPLGADKASSAAALFSGTRAGIVSRTDILPGRAIQVGAVQAALPEIETTLSALACRNNRVALAALLQIEKETAAAIGRYGAARIAVVLGTSTSGMAEGEAALAHRLSTGQWPAGYRYSQQELGNLAEFVARHLKLGGPAYTIATACSSSAKAFASARRLIRLGICDAALVGGVDTLCGLTVAGFDSLGALSKSMCNPFSANRDGITIGEGGAIFLMTREPSEVALLGYGESADAHHMSAPDPEGKGALAAMQKAVTDSGLQSAEIGYVNLHGTATPLNDAMESKAVNTLLGDAVPCSSTKAMTGHTLGAAGAIEAAFCWLTLHRQFNTEGRLPPHLWDGVADPNLAPLNLLAARTMASGLTAAISNSFAFGGSNASLVLGRS